MNITQWLKAGDLGSDSLCLNLGFSVYLLCDFEQITISVSLFPVCKMGVIIVIIELLRRVNGFYR